jgi:hypothetical protein
LIESARELACSRDYYCFDCKIWVGWESKKDIVGMMKRLPIPCLEIKHIMSLYPSRNVFFRYTSAAISVQDVVVYERHVYDLEIIL